ncbi:hypothetical protein BV25DRAFT_1827015 [Artomyces pyxidatus]|uniref:Uncharacterized protein n=1 Tax=Artomyces pyxidatus TaxID=48021 RepID=A0ACB8SXG9_9AGAM|nr:hypothetical protein BV25DRAFT_1827015 [Artomyces pyxidatus]
MQSSSSELLPKFGPSNRAADPSWAVVPTNVEKPGAVDESLSRAIEESITANYNDFATQAYERPPLEECVRRDGRPVALRPTSATSVYAALALQALYFVPQVRASVASWRPSSYDDDTNPHPPTDGHEYAMWSLLEMFSHMDLAVITEMNADKLLKEFETEIPRLSDSPGELTFSFLSNLTRIVETALHKDIATESHQWPRLFHFRYGFADKEPNEGPFDSRLDSPVVRVDVHTDGTQPMDLVACLAKQLSLDIRQQVIFEPSAVVMFHLVRHETLPSYSSGPAQSRQRFRYPLHVYLDQFLKENVEVSAAKQQEQEEINEKILALRYKEGELKRRNKTDVLKDLRSTLHYYEHVANKDDPMRRQTIDSMAMKLRKAVTRIENEIETIDSQIGKLQAQSASIFDSPELKQHRYDLRAVLVHDGVLGRKHLYTYVNEGGTWWKTVDYEVTEVSEETVLTDSAGLHLNGGPYILMYSRVLSDEQIKAPCSWPEALKRKIKDNNRQFLSEVPPEAARLARHMSSGSSSPSQWDTPSSSVAAPSSPRGDPMDMSP